jgi:hypothetical protein
VVIVVCQALQVSGFEATAIKDPFVELSGQEREEILWISAWLPPPLLGKKLEFHGMSSDPITSWYLPFALSRWARQRRYVVEAVLSFKRLTIYRSALNPARGQCSLAVLFQPLDDLVLHLSVLGPCFALETHYNEMK